MPGLSPKKVAVRPRKPPDSKTLPSITDKESANRFMASRERRRIPARDKEDDYVIIFHLT